MGELDFKLRNAPKKKQFTVKLIENVKSQIFMTSIFEYNKFTNDDSMYARLARILNVELGM